MIYTSYFGRLRKLPTDIVPVAICGQIPDWYDGLSYKQLAPKWYFFAEWKKTHDNDYYIEHFVKDVLDPLDADEVVEDLYRLSSGKDVCLLCYERPEEFCHRHIVAEWLCENGYECEELTI